MSPEPHSFDSAASNGVVDIPDLASDTLNKLSDALPAPVALPCLYCDRPRVPCRYCKPSNMRAAAIHNAHENTEGVWTCAAHQTCPGEAGA